MMMGISEEEETKHEIVVRSQERPQQRPPLTRQQVLQHLSILQKRMGQMQSFAKGLSDQAQQDKLKIRTLKQQLEAAKTLQWAKQTSLDAAAARASPPKASPAHGLPPTSTPRLEQIRRSRQERETKLRAQFSNSASVSDSEHMHTLELEQKLHTLEEDYQTLQDTTYNFQVEKESMLFEHSKALSGKDAIIHELEEEMKGMETLIKDSYNERESLQKRLTKLSEKKNSLDVEVEAREEISIELKKRDREMKLQLLEAHDTLELLRNGQLDDSLEALAVHEEQNQLILQLELIAETWEHQANKASRLHPADHANQMQVEQDQGKDIFDLNSKVVQLEKQIQKQVDAFHNETIEMEMELMDAEESNRMQTEMLEAQEMELLLLSNAFSDLQKDHPLQSKTVSNVELFAISECEEGDEETPHEQSGKSAQHPSHPTQFSPTSKNSIVNAEDAEEAEIVELARKAYLLTQRCNIYLLSRKFEWQLERGEQLENRLEKQNMKYDALVAKNAQMSATTNTERESKTQKVQKVQEEQVGEENKAQASSKKEANDADEEKKSMTRALLRASMSIRELQQELKKTKEQAAQLESQLKRIPQEENEDGKDADPSSFSALQSRLEEEKETNALLKEFMEDLKESHAKEREDWDSQQRDINKRIDQLSQKLKESKDKSNGVAGTSPPSPAPQSFTRPLDDTVHKKNPEERPAISALPSETPMGQELKSEISVVRSEISRLMRTLHSKQPQNESFLGALSESGSHQSDDYIFCDDKSDENMNTKDELVTGGSNSNASPPESWYEEFSALKQELNDLTLELRKSHHDEKAANVTPPRVDLTKGPDSLQTDPAFPDDASVDSSSTGGFESEILLLREEVHRQQRQQQGKVVVAPCLGVSSARSSPPPLPAAGSSLVSSLEDSSISENNAFSSFECNASSEIL